MNIINWIYFNLLKIKKNKHPVLFFLHLLKSKIIFLIGDNFTFLLPLSLFKYKRNNYYLHYAPNQFSKVLYTYPHIVRHPDDEVFLATYLKSGDNYIDIGANIGTTTLASAVTVGQNGKVIAYEAHTETFKYLTRSVMNNSGIISKNNTSLIARIILRNIALGNSNNKINFSNIKNHDDINHVIVSSEGKEGNKINSEKKDTISVPMVRLDDVTLPAHIDLIKIDVEGYEFEVFKGARNVLSKTDAIFFEVFDKNSAMFDYESKQVLDFLFDLDFSIFTIDIESKILKIVSRNTYTGSPNCENMIAVRSVEDLIKRTGFTTNK